MQGEDMGIGTSIILIAVGAILKFAVDLKSTVGGTIVHWDTVGIILMIVGAIGLVVSLLWLRQSTGAATRERVVERDPYTTP
jgi:hypothetical protein